MVWALGSTKQSSAAGGSNTSHCYCRGDVGLHRQNVLPKELGFVLIHRQVHAWMALPPEPSPVSAIFVSTPSVNCSNFGILTPATLSMLALT
jgi:hypothetical protein